MPPAGWPGPPARASPTSCGWTGWRAPAPGSGSSSSAGRVVQSTTAAPGRSLDAVREIVRRAPSGSTTARVARADGSQVIVLLFNHSVRSTLSTLLGTLVAVGVGILIAAGLMGAFLARRALRPVDRMRQQVDDIPGDALDRRITEGRPDELGGSPTRSTGCSSAPSTPPTSSSGSWPTHRTS